MKKTVLVVGLLATFSTIPALAQFKYVEDRDYQPIATQIEKVEQPKIIEFFWYGCPHCYDMHGPLQNWVDNEKPENILIENVPAIPSPRWEVGAQLYYTAQALDLDVDDAVFDEFHKARNYGIIFDPEKAKSFLVSHGGNKDAVEKAWGSFGVKQKVSRAKKMFRDSGLSGVPAFVVNGAYEVPFSGNYETFFPKLGALAVSSRTQK